MEQLMDDIEEMVAERFDIAKKAGDQVEIEWYQALMLNLALLEEAIDKAIIDDQSWSRDNRSAPQIHFRLNVSGLKRVPDATFTMDGDIRDLGMYGFFERQIEFQAKVDELYPLPVEPTKEPLPKAD